MAFFGGRNEGGDGDGVRKGKCKSYERRICGFWRLFSM